MKRVILGQPSWNLQSSSVEAWVTETGGQVGPVTFGLGRRRIRPYSVAPWAEEKLDPATPPIIRVLRGDFFCLPFGGNDTPYRGEKHPVHGETANAKWRLESSTPHVLHLSLRTRRRKARVDKRISLVDGHNAIYSQHVISGMSGLMNYGHHAMLKFPAEEGSGRISTCRFAGGQVFPGQFEDPAKGGYSFLKPGASFRSLDKVPAIDGSKVDLTPVPARRGYEDLVTIVADPEQPLAWTAVTFPKQRYVWFSMKDPQVLRQTVFWISNAGRHMAPWNGRHAAVMGLEDVTSYFHYGLAESAKPNPYNRRGISTAVKFSPRRPLVVNYIQAVAAIPAGFDRVKSIVPANDGSSVKLRSGSGKSVDAPLDVGFLWEK